MRLLKQLAGHDGFELVSFDNDLPPPYAILSHTWKEGQEITYDELIAKTGAKKEGYDKLRFCAERTAADGLEYFWVDTCCIDKSRSDELSTSINYMFRWYQRASRCYVYLSDVSVSDEVTDVEAYRTSWVGAFRRSRWFKRGWTLQELLAPASVEFFSSNRKRLGTRASLEKEIVEITGIPVGAFHGDMLAFSVEERMKWAAHRSTTLKEDKVYCLLGIFGVFLPLIYGEGEQYATMRLKDEIRRRQKACEDTELRSLPPRPLLPFPRNERFIGREAHLTEIAKNLFCDHYHQRLTIYGLGGCGKSALALETAYRALADGVKRSVFWVPAMTHESFDVAFREIGNRLRIPGPQDDNADVKRLVHEALSQDTSASWLMIVDNADDAGVLLEQDQKSQKRLMDYIPYSVGGSVLFTTRSRKAATAMTQDRILKLDDMGHSEAHQLLARHIWRKELLNDETVVTELLESLTGLPLAIVQAIAFINENDMSLSAYVSLLQEADTKADIFSEDFEDSSRYQEMDNTIAKTWYISFEQIKKQDPLAMEYLSFIACIDRINIPGSILPPAQSQVQYAKALGTLTGYAFLTEQQQAFQKSDKERRFDMHRLVHLALNWWLEGHDQQETWRGVVTARLTQLLPYGGHEEREIWTAYLPHASKVASFYSALHIIIRAELLERIGRCQASLGQYAAAESAHRVSWAIRSTVLGYKHVDTLESMSRIPFVMVKQGKYKESEAVAQQNLAWRKETLGAHHPDTLMSMTNLAIVLETQGKSEQSEAMHRQTLSLRETVLGPKHPETLKSMGNLAVMLKKKGNYKESESMNRQILALRKKILGPQHPETLGGMSNLASVLSRQGYYEESESLFRQVLNLRSEVLGPHHPETLISITDLALAYKDQRRYEEAEMMLRQALTVASREDVLGPRNLLTLHMMNNLASVLCSQCKYEEAASVIGETLASSLEVVGLMHPQTLTAMSIQALVLRDQGKYDQSELMMRRMLELCVEMYGPKHPGTLQSAAHLTWLLWRKGNYQESEEIGRRTLALREEVLGPRASRTLRSMRNLVSVLRGQGKDEEAELMDREFQDRCK